MPRANPNVVGAQATILVLPRTDKQEFKINAPKLFERTNEKGPVWGLRYMLEVGSGEHAGKDVPVELYFHSEGSFGINKQFLMAAYGYEMSSAGEEKFNADHVDTDFVVDTEEKFIAPIWSGMVGGRICAEVDKKVYNGRDVNSFTWMPFN